MPAYSTHYCLPAAYCVLRTAAYCAYCAYCGDCAYCAYCLLCGDCLTCLLRTAHRSPPTTPRGAGAHEAARGEESRARGLRRPGQRRQETGARSLRSGMKEARIKPYRLAPHRACAHVPYHPGPGWRWRLGSWGQTVGRCAKQRRKGRGGGVESERAQGRQRTACSHFSRCPLPPAHFETVRFVRSHRRARRRGARPGRARPACTQAAHVAHSDTSRHRVSGPFSASPLPPDLTRSLTEA